MYIMLLTIRLAQIPIHEEVFLKEDWLSVQAYPFPRQLRLAVCHLGARNIHASTNRRDVGYFRNVGIICDVWQQSYQMVEKQGRRRNPNTTREPQQLMILHLFASLEHR